MTIQHTLATVAGTALGGIDAFGALGFAFGTTASLMRRRTGILLSAAVAGTCFTVHFLRLGSTSGAAMCALAVGQNLLSVAFVRGGRPPSWITATFAACALAAVASTVATWGGPHSALAGLGAVLATLARLQHDTGPMRRRFLAASGCWAGHDLIVGSACSLACDLLSMAGFVAALARAGNAQGSEGKKLRFFRSPVAIAESCVNPSATTSPTDAFACPPPPSPRPTTRSWPTIPRASKAIRPSHGSAWARRRSPPGTISRRA